MEIKEFIRGSGVLLSIASLPSPYGIGTLGREAYEFVDLLVDLKQKYWQVLPSRTHRLWRQSLSAYIRLRRKYLLHRLGSSG